MQQGRQRRVSDEDFIAIFAKYHGIAEREYYTLEYGAGSTWQACADAIIGRGACKRTGAARGCE